MEALELFENSLALFVCKLSIGHKYAKVISKMSIGHEQSKHKGIILQANTPLSHFCPTTLRFNNIS
jgi:hypothetical protein